MGKIIFATAVCSLMCFSSAEIRADDADSFDEVSAEIQEAEKHFDGLSFMIGVGGTFAKNKPETRNGGALDSQQTNRFMGTVGVGYGKLLCNSLHIGAEFLLDISKSKKQEIKAGDQVVATSADGGGSIKNSGFTPSVAVRVGYASQLFNAMAYGKLGVSIVSGEYRNREDVKKSLKCATPELAFGIEKSFCKKFSTRLEAGYQFTKKKEVLDVKTKLSQGINARILACYNI
jgi:hypothetical protein